MQFTIQSLPLEERPREKLVRKGSEALSIAELLAVILGTGTKNKSVIELSYEIIAHFGTLQNLSDATIPELTQIKGLGNAKAVQLKAAITLGLKVSKEVIAPDFTIQCPHDVYLYMKDELENLKQEHFVVILLNAKGQVVMHETVTKGTQTKCLVDFRHLFNLAVRYHAVGFIAVHNHPSGDPTPSQDDMDITETLSQGGRLMGIHFQDHIIIGKKSYSSLFDRKKIFTVRDA